MQVECARAFRSVAVLLFLSALNPLPSAGVASNSELEQLSKLSIFELLEVKIASGFLESELNVGSTVSKVTEEQWRKQGARRTFEAIQHVPGVYVSNYLYGSLVPSFRGFAAADQFNSFLLLLDGIPLNAYSSGSGIFGTPNFSLGNLKNIEVIRGPGSAMYGAYAFQGVVSLNTWSSDENRYEAWGEGGNHGSWHGTARFRQSLGEQAVLTAMISGSGLDDAHIKEEYHPSPGAKLVTSRVSGEYDNITTSAKLAISDFEAAFYYSRNRTDDSFGTGEFFDSFPNGGHSAGNAKMMALKLSHQAELVPGWEVGSHAYHTRDELVGPLA
jgi:iron complex outermembrane receptor protein